ncbi:MAG: trypsin-like peptidase domain-containing protein [Chloroflexi bacterium]|nr:trypsin-like peptidase domain-containing protein [Chloroflexota bacterium]
MKRIILPILAAALIGFGALLDHLLTPPSSQPVLASSGASAPATYTSSPASPSTSASASAIDAATEHAYAVASPSVVFVNSVGTGTGSGIIYDARGDIVTNAHVVQGASTLRVTLNDGRTFNATLVGTDAADDLAVIRINASHLTPAHFAPAGGYRVAETVLAIGSPLGLQQSVTSGLISGLNRAEQEPNGAYLPNAVQTSAPINPGNSGGALVALDGTVVGMPTLEQTGSQNGGTAQAIGFAIPSDRIVAMANQIIARARSCIPAARTWASLPPTGRRARGSGAGSSDRVTVARR